MKESKNIKPNNKDSITKKWWFWAIPIFIFVAVVGLLGRNPNSNNSQTSQQTQNNDSSTQANNTDESQKKDNNSTKPEYNYTPPADTSNNTNDDTLEEAKATCIGYGERTKGYKNFNVSVAEGNIMQAQDNGSILIKSKVKAGSILSGGKSTATMECTTTADGMTVTGFNIY